MNCVLLSGTVLLWENISIVSLKIVNTFYNDGRWPEDSHTCQLRVIDRLGISSFVWHHQNLVWISQNNLLKSLNVKRNTMG